MINNEKQRLKDNIIRLKARKKELEEIKELKQELLETENAVNELNNNFWFKIKRMFKKKY